MDCISTRLPYRQTVAFAKIALDYIDQAAALKPFFAFPPTLQGIQKAIEKRKQTVINRAVLVEELKKQYDKLPATDLVKRNIDSLLSASTFTVTTAHQNNIFTGPLFFIYKIIHAIRLTDHLNESLPDNHFVPVFYIGSEDADMEELNHIYLQGEKLTWPTKQKGAVGRMKVDKELVQLIERMQGQLDVLPNGKDIIDLLKKYYTTGTAIQDATAGFVNALFGEYGLIILLPDNAPLKKLATGLFEDELFHQHSSGIVEETAGRLQAAGYKTQVNPREINLFYLKDDARDRMEKAGEGWRVVGRGIKFSKDELLTELQNHPERFSPNVILRGLYQETILPNIGCIGGAGETAYWLQLKNLFDHYSIPFPVLVLRNSFLIVEKKWQQAIRKLGLNAEDFFESREVLLKKIVERESRKKLKLNGSFEKVEALYQAFKKQAASVDASLEKHVEALRTKALNRLQELEKKMLRAEKRKFADQQRQVNEIRAHLFPGNGLQERNVNLCYYYAKWGPDLIRQLYTHSLSLEQEFVILQEK